MTLRAKLSTTVDRQLLEAIDTYVASHSDMSRGAVIDDAIRLWQTRQREQAMEAQYAESPSPEEAAEREEWRQIRRVAAARLLSRPR